MKANRIKKVRRILKFYQNNFKLTKPYKILVDGTFLKAALESKINLREQLPTYLGASVEVTISECALNELRVLGAPVFGALHIAKTLESHACGHMNHPGVADGSVTPLTASECILKVIRRRLKVGDRSWMVGTVDAALTEKLRSLVGLPVLYIGHCALLLDKPSEFSRSAAADEVGRRLEGGAIAADRKRHFLLDKNSAEGAIFAKKKHRGPKGPNPLSCKKKKNGGSLKVDDKTVRASPVSFNDSDISKKDDSDLSTRVRKRSRHRRRKSMLDTAMKVS